MSTTKFPRGGSLDQGNSNKRKVEDDALFGSKRLKRIEVSNNKTNKNKLNKKNTEKSITIQPTLNQSLTSVGLGMVKSSGINNDYARVDHLSKSKYVVGTQAIGYILTVTKKFIVLSLPGGVTGIVLPQEISDYYHQLYLNGSDEFHMNVDTILEQNGIIHQPLICISLGIEDKSDDNKNPHLLLSLRGSLINKTLTLKNLYVDFPLVGCISSIEDIGYIISTGIIGITAFLPKNNVPSDIGELRLGQRIDCVISSINEIARTVTLTAKHKAVKETIVDNMSISFNSIRAGMLFNVRITSFVENGLLVSFLESFNGAIDIFSLSRPYSSKEIRSKYKKDELLISRIVFIDHSNKSVRLSIRPHIIDYKPPVALPSLGEIIENLEVKYAHKYVGLILTNMQTSEDDTIEKNAELVESALKPEDANTKVKKINKKQLKLQLKQEREEDELIPGYYINRSSLNDPKTNKPLDRNENVLDHYPLSTIISQAKVTGYFLVEGYGSATNLYDYVTNDITHNSQLKVGQIISGTVVSIQATGVVSKLSDKQGVYDVNSYYIGQSVECVVIDYVEATNSSNYRIKLALNIGDTNDFLSDTLKPVEKSHIHSDSHTKVIATNNQHKLELVNGTIIRINEVALVYLKDLSDTYVTNPSHDFPNESFKYQLSLKYSIVQGNEDLKKEILKLVIGNIVIGTVSKVKEFGVFVDIKDTKVTGLSRINDAVDNATLDLREVYTVGDIVRAKILSVDTVHNKVSLGLKTRYFKNDDMNDDEDNTNDDVEIDDIADEDTNELQLDNHDELDYDEAVDNRKFGDNDRILEPIDYTSDDDDIERLIQSANIDNSYDIDIDDDEKEETTIANKRKISLVDDDEDIDSDVETSTTLFTKKLFANKSYNDANNLIVWDDFNKLSSNNKDEDSNSDSDNYDDTSITITNTKRSRQKDNKKRKEEETIRSKELQLTKGSTLPESSNDFERLLISQPNSSYIWIQYMTFYLKSANINEAREVAERALKSILFREEDEKFNVWIAYINMEYKFGTTDTLEKVFKRAVNESKGKYIYLSMAQSYEQNNHISEAEDIYNK
eukprot:gene16871-22359_t